MKTINKNNNILNKMLKLFQNHKGKHEDEEKLLEEVRTEIKISRLNIKSK